MKVITIIALVIVSSIVSNVRAYLHSVYSFSFVGTVEGKTYFAENAVNRTWIDAKAFCLSQAMQLATVTSTAERQFLGNSASQFEFNGYFWTAGRDAQTVHQFVWDNNKAPLNASVVDLSNVDIPISNCVYFHIETMASPTAGHFHVDYCESEHGTLCEREELLFG